MKRREMLATLAGGGAGTLLEACGGRMTSMPSVTAEEVRTIAKAMTGSDVPLDEAERIRADLHSYRFATATLKPEDVDPRTQPAFVFDPEVDLG